MSCPVKQRLRFADSALCPRLTTAHLLQRDLVAHVLAQDLPFLGPNSSSLRCFAALFLLLSQALPVPNHRDVGESLSIARSWWVKESWAATPTLPISMRQQEVLGRTTSGLAAHSCWGADASRTGFAILPQRAPGGDSSQKGQRQDLESSPGLKGARNGSWLRGPGCKVSTQGPWGVAVLEERELLAAVEI